ncbi:MAG: DUF29 domain-containing protein [Gammaproteobacteria bacterium]|jgi:hypothetical protein|nr:DUF29 domain-containing protein [Gammaproteobacteria bacterium]
MSDLDRLYEQDYSAWAARTAALLRQRRFTELDLDHLIEELDDMGRSQRHELVNRLRVLLAHLLKWQFQYGRLSERWADFEGRSWRNTIIEQRAALSYLMDKNPGLKRVLEDAIGESYVQALNLAVDETGLPAATFPVACPYQSEQIFSRDFYPETTS